MPRRAQRLCPHCHTPYTGRCPRCTAEDRDRRDQRRPSAQDRGYGKGHRAFRAAVLARDPTCVCPGCPHCTLASRRCLEDASQADHYPRTRRELEAAGEDPNDPQHGRGLCASCHGYHTATTTGWGGAGVNR